MGRISYYLNGVEIRSYGIRVEEAKGLFSVPERKSGVSHGYDDEHGIRTDVEQFHVRERSITLKCFTEKMSHGSFISRMNTLKGVLYQGGMQELRVLIEGVTNPLVYEVYYEGKSDMQVTYDGANQVGTFDIVLTEPCPCKYVAKIVTTAASQELTVELTGSVSKMYDVYWGDGTVDSHWATGDDGTHTYAAAGTYYLVVTGDVNLVTVVLEGDTEMTLEVLWSRLL